MKVLLTLFLAAQGTWTMKDNCDESSEPLKTLKRVSQEECQRSCDAEANCKGIVYITGWNRCYLKADLKKQSRLRFVSGDLNDKHAFESSSLKADHDHTGKDLERKVLDTPEACGQACADRKDCEAFTYLDGYRVCWLKAKGGSLLSKVFRCGSKS